jgi:GrpB-like predicted nucleotidyltransferase (UPF0157 family)
VTSLDPPVEIVPYDPSWPMHHGRGANPGRVAAGDRGGDEGRYCYASYHAEFEHWLCKPSPAFRTHHLHLIAVGTPQWLRPLASRDYLRTHAGASSEYEALKRRLAQEHHHDREAYTQAKRPFIDRIADTALVWATAL